MEQRRIMTAWRVVFWILPVLVLVGTLGMQACGSDDDDDCGDSVEFETELECEAYAALYDCEDFSYDEDTEVCDVFDCGICDIFDDDDVDDVF